MCAGVRPRYCASCVFERAPPHVKRLHQVCRHHRDPDECEPEDQLGHPIPRKRPAVVPRVTEAGPPPTERLLDAEISRSMLVLLADQGERRVGHELQLPRKLEVKGCLGRRGEGGEERGDEGKSREQTSRSRQRMDPPEAGPLRRGEAYGRLLAAA